MKKILKELKDNSDLVIEGLAIMAIGITIVAVNQTSFIKGGKELMQAKDDGRLDSDF